MRTNGSRQGRTASELAAGQAGAASRGRANRPILWALGLAAGALVAGGVWPDSLPADAETRKCSDLQALCETDQAWHRRAVAFRELASINSKDSRAALEALADSKDERVAAQALAQIARSNLDGADKKLKAVIEDTKRSAVARSFAVTAWCAKEKRAGRSWNDVKSYLDSKCSVGSAADAAKAAKASLWGEK